ncbi:ComEC/Rec2 family competence protein [Clostridium celatum]|uniref:ComEC/Rec2-like protein n=1 Tax=Clostridium celatum DSM 1785 TaxID=545697 RepID=L1Q4C7_9CLOT|nr:ComEC/Rec2 family competence protein [Clostridium celatum]EKY22756.1 ComEC/Rec2-like protein [Clostridium celatum DSM 1785]
MKLCTEKSFNNPLIYIFVVSILASICYEMYSKNKLLAIFVVSSFFIFIFKLKGNYIAIILILFFTIFIFNNIWFYQYIPDNIEEIRIIEVKNYYGKGKINGRNVNLYNINNEIKVGQKILAKGEFSKDNNIIKGYIGEYKINFYKIKQDDFISTLYKEREKIFKKIEEKLGNRKAALITSVAFGYKSELGEEDRDIMGELGISHAISVSGLHLSLIFSVLSKIFGIKMSLIISFIYVLFTGAPPSSVRAYIMIFIMSFGVVLRKTYNSLAALSLAGIIILLIRPYEVFGLGFILSFLATLGIILFNKDLNKKLYKLPNKIRDTVSISLCAQVFTLPILVLYFGEVSISFILGNMLVVPFIVILVILGNVLLVIQMIIPIFNYCLYLCNYIIKIIDFIMYKINNIGLELLYLHYSVAYFYIAILTTYYYYKRGFKRFLYYPLIIAIYILVLIYSPFLKIRYYKDGALLVSYKGNRVLIETSDYVDTEKLKRVTLADKIVRKVNRINIANEFVINGQGKNYILYTTNNKYLLLVNYEKIDWEYDIIDFRKGDIEEIIILNDKFLKGR